MKEMQQMEEIAIRTVQTSENREAGKIDCIKDMINGCKK